MAVSPIELFSPGQSILGRMLAGGSNVFAEAIQNTVRSASGIADNQVRQERDFLMERRNEENLAQRRAENLRSNFEADRLFDFRERTDERDFGFRAEQAALADADRDRAFEQSKTASEAAAQVRQDELGLSRDRLGVAKDELQIKKDEAKREQAFNEFIVSPEYGPKLPGATTSPEELFAVADARQQAAAETKNGPAYLDATREKAAAKAAMVKDGVGSAETEAQARARRNEQRQLAKDAEAAIEKEAKEIVADTTAFAPQVPFQELNEKGEFKDQKAGAAAQARDKDAFTYEKNLATSISKDDFIKRGGDIPDASKKRRARFWELVNGNAPAATNSAASSWIEQNKMK